MSKWLNEKELVLSAARKMEEKGLIKGTCGNVSLRLPAEEGRELLAITPTSIYYDLLTPADIPVIDFEARPVEGSLPPSSEIRMHINLYRARKDVHAVVHTHSVYASALSSAHLEIPPILEDQVLLVGGEVRLARYAPSGSDDLARSVPEAMGDSNAVLLMHHGMVGVGRNIRDALTVCETVEKAAQAYYICLTLGKPFIMDEEAVKAGKAYFRRHQFNL